ncbi:c-type cytochrome [Catenovulum sediminis]|uniref:C-type cytochrome n=1 Tax=Catenovulum sediminis TaxID=1740262 RepID=A0ABV1RFR5_9ALTE
MNHTFNFKFILMSMLLFNSVAHSNPSDLDKQIETMSLQTEHLTAGQKTFESVCAACHSADLSGAMGFNLKDGEWVHGGQPSDIFKNIQNGFSQAGMPAFKNILNEQQVKQITAYILSKREGWDNLTYKIYTLGGDKSRSWAQLENHRPVKQGPALRNMPDFSMPESEEFAIEFTGDFYAPREQDTALYVKAPHVLIDVYIDGQPVKKVGNQWSGSWPLKRGKQQMTFRLMTPPKPFPKYTRTNAPLIVTNKENTIKLFAASKVAEQQLAGTDFPIKADKSIQVQRKVVVDLPPYTVAVGLLEKVNYGFNTRSCAISGVWLGDMLNIGPNIKGRGQDGSVPLGKWLFNSDAQIMPKSNQCEFIKYNRQAETRFDFKLQNVYLSMQGVATDGKTLSLNYQVLSNPKNVNDLQFKLPANKAMSISVTGGQIKSSHKGKTFVVNPAQNKNFSIQIKATGAE